jgi:hypothetical protein
MLPQLVTEGFVCMGIGKKHGERRWRLGRCGHARALPLLSAAHRQVLSVKQRTCHIFEKIGVLVKRGRGRVLKSEGQ